MNWALFGASLLPLILSHCGRWHPAGDAFAVLRPVWAVPVLVVGLIAGLPTLVLLVPIASLLTVLWPVLRPQPAPSLGLTLYQKNLSFQLADPTPLIADIRATDPDVITLQEVSAENTTLLDTLADRWPHQHLCPHAPVGGVAVLSRHAPVEHSTPVCATSLAAVQISTPAGPLWVASLHLPWPWPFTQHLYRDRAAAALHALDGPVVLAGDFNMVPWSHTLGMIARAIGGHRAGRALPTFRIGPVGLPIDHCVAPGAARATLRPCLGSDHKGLTVEF